MAKKKTKAQKKSGIDNLQFKPIVIAFIAGLFFGTYAANANALMLFVAGVLTGLAIAASVYMTSKENKLRKANREKEESE